MARQSFHNFAARQVAPAVSSRSFSSAKDVVKSQPVGADGGAVTLMDETPKEFMLRWMDVFGHLTRFFNRKVWVSDTNPNYVYE